MKYWSRTIDDVSSSSSEASLGSHLVLVLLLFSATFLTCGTSLAFAQQPAELTREIRETKEKIRKEQDRLKELKEEATKIESKLKNADEQLARISRGRDELQESLRELEIEKRELERLIVDTERLGEARRGALQERIVATYKMYRRSAAFDFVVQATGSTNFLKRAYLFSVVADYDQTRLNQLGELLEEFNREKLQLVTLEEERRKRLSRLEELEQQLEEAKIAQGRLFAAAKQKAGEQEVTVAKLQIAARDLERVLGRIMGGRFRGGTVVTSQEEPEPKGFAGPGLFDLRGKLKFPVKGSVVQKFGKQRHESFDDILYVKGIEVLSSVGDSVKAVAKGEIIFNQVLPGYGNVLVIDHGQRYYTLYGRLASSFKRVGDVVEEGTELAVLGEEDEKGRNFYFELRLKGKAIDPIKYFDRQTVSIKS